MAAVPIRFLERRLPVEQDPQVALQVALVARCMAGDSGAWELLVQQNNRRVFNLCYRFTGSMTDAEDLTQDVFIKIYRTLASFDPDKSAFTTWMTTVARNLLVDHFRRSKQDRSTDSMDASPENEQDGAASGLRLSDRIEDRAPRPDERVETREKQQWVQRGLQELSPELREAVILRDLQDMDYKEIATSLKVPEGTVKSRINRGRAELARVLQRIK
ncbi:MAG: sigma-70 family RNA polymerase sigma factor [Acidobacteriaceae bacterium]